MIYCPHCGASSPDSARFCTKCGEALVTDASAQEALMSRCPKCGFRPTTPSRFCTECGTSLVLEPAKSQPQTAPQEESAEPQTNPPEQQTSAPQPQPVIPVQPYPQQPTLLQSFCSRLHTSAILLLIAGILQGIGAIITLIVGIVSLSEVGDLFHRTYYMGDYYTAATAAGVATLIGIFVTGLCMAAICVCDLVIAGRLFSYSKQVQDRPVGILEQYTSTGKLIVLLVFNILFGGIFGIIGAAFLLSASSIVRNNSNAFADMEQNASRF